MDRMRPLFATLFALLMLAGASLAADPAPHQKILVDLDTPAAEAAFRDIAGRLDVLMVKPGHHAEIAVQPREMELINQSGLGFKVLDENMEATFGAKNYGPNYGLYHTYSESVAWMDDLHAQYPAVISEKWSIGQTLEGNDIWCLRVSDNPGVDEGEPEVLIDGMHHAREIMASEFPMMFAEYLAENYGTDPEITWLVDNRELYIVPIVNVDGQLYNEQTNPYGGGMWRKTRSYNNGSYGVDPNRNYPYEWAHDNNGSSPYPSDETYRGPYAGSENCVQAMMAFINDREFITHDSVHTYSNLLLYPWGYTSTDTPHGATFEYMAEIMTRYNGYEPGQPSDILYDVNGGAIDWVYGAQDEHPMVLSFSTEIGGYSDGFWPDEARRQPLFEENIWPHIYLMRAAGPFIAVNSPYVVGDNKSIAPGENGYLDFTIENQSVVASALDLSVTVSTDDAWVQFGASEISVGDLAAMSSTTIGQGALPISVDAGCPNGHLVPFEVVVHMAEGDLSFDLAFMVGTPNNIFSDSFENSLTNWTTTGEWGLTSNQYHSFVNSLTDSPIGEYDDQEETYAQLNGSYQAATLSFWHRYEIEAGWDYGRVQVSANGGAWTTLQSFDGFQTSWQQVTIDLDEYAGQDLRFRFLLDTDYSVTEDGWYIDDVTLTGAGSEDLAPAAPVAISPVGGAVTGPEPELVVSNTMDPEGNDVNYGFRVYGDAACTQLVAATDGVLEGEGQTAWICDSLAEGTYYWRAYGSDGSERSLLSEAASFVVQASTPVGDLVIDGPRLQVLGNVTGSGARLQLNLPAGANTSVAIYDARGARVRRLHSGFLGGGDNVLVWDGRDSHGRHAGSGVYFVRAMAGGEALTGRLVVVR